MSNEVLLANEVSSNDTASNETVTSLENLTKYTISLRDLYILKQSVNNILQPELKLVQADSLEDLNQALIQDNLRLKNATVELNPKVGEAASATVSLSTTDQQRYLGFNTITVVTKPLENKIIDKLKPSDISASNGLTISPSNTNYCGLNQIEVKDIALASNLSYTLVPSDLNSWDTEGKYYTKTFDFAGDDGLNFLSDEDKLSYRSSNPEITAPDIFGAKDFTLNVPLVEYHNFVIDVENMTSMDSSFNKVYVPASVEKDMDGTGGTPGKIGFKRVGLQVIKKMPISKERANNAIISGESWKFGVNNELVDSPDDISGMGIGYPSITLSPFTQVSIPLAKSYFILKGKTDHVFNFDAVDSNFNFSTYEINNKEEPCAVFRAEFLGGTRVNIQEDANFLGTNNLISFFKDSQFKINYQSGFYNTTPSNKLADNTYKLVDTLAFPILPFINIDIDLATIYKNASGISNLQKHITDYINDTFPVLKNKHALLYNVGITSIPEIKYDIDFPLNTNKATVKIDHNKCITEYKVDADTKGSAEILQKSLFEKLNVEFVQADGENCLISVIYDNNQFNNLDNKIIFTSSTRIDKIPAIYDNYLLTGSIHTAHKSSLVPVCKITTDNASMRDTLPTYDALFFIDITDETLHETDTTGTRPSFNIFEVLVPKKSIDDVQINKVHAPINKYKDDCPYYTVYNMEDKNTDNSKILLCLHLAAKESLDHLVRFYYISNNSNITDSPTADYWAGIWMDDPESGGA